MNNPLFTLSAVRFADGSVRIEARPINGVNVSINKFAGRDGRPVENVRITVTPSAAKSMLDAGLAAPATEAAEVEALNIPIRDVKPRNEAPAPAADVPPAPPAPDATA